MVAEATQKLSCATTKKCCLVRRYWWYGTIHLGDFSSTDVSCIRLTSAVVVPYHIAALLLIVSSEKGRDKGGLTRTLPEKREPKRTITFIPTI